MGSIVDWIKHNKLLAVVLVLCVGFAGYYLASAVTWIPYPNQIDYGEGLITYINKMWADGTWKWDMNVPPYLPLMYGVGMPVLSIPLIKIFGADLWVGRLMMFVGTIVICWLLYKIVKRATGNTALSIVGGLLPLSHPIIRDWSLMARVDMLSVVFDVAGFFVAYRYKDSRKIYWSIPLFLFAGLTKISSLAGLGAVLIYLLIYNRKIFVQYARIAFVVFITIFGAVQLASGGEYFNHIVTYNMTKKPIWDLPIILSNQIIVFAPMVIITLMALLYSFYSIRQKRIDMFGLFFLIGLLSNSILALRPGGFVNYYLELIIGASLCATLLLPTVIARASTEYAATHKVKYYGLMLAFLFVDFITMSPKHAFPFPNGEYKHDIEVATQLIADTNKPIISENMGLVMNAGKDIVTDYFIISNMALLGRWDSTLYVSNYKNQYYDYIVLRIPAYKRLKGDGHFTQEIIEAINANYTIIYQPPENFYWYGIVVYEANNKLNGDIK